MTDATPKHDLSSQSTAAGHEGVEYRFFHRSLSGFRLFTLIDDYEISSPMIVTRVKCGEIYPPIRRGLQ